MDYKEEYQKALERAKKGLPLEEVFPELKESEDERIRKELISFVNKYYGEETKKEVLAYLERQKKQKPLCVSFACDWLKTNIRNYVNSEYNEFHHCVEYDGSVDTEKLIKDFELAMQKEPKDVSASTMAPGCWQGEEKSAGWSEDERIINQIISLIKEVQEDEDWHIGKWSDDAIAWLEKKKEQKPEPVFKVGDKIKLKSEPKYPYREIVDIRNGAYYFDAAVYLPFKEQDKWEAKQKPAEPSDDCFGPKDVFRFNLTSVLYNYGKEVAAKCLNTHILNEELNEYVTDADVNRVVSDKIELLKRNALQKPAGWTDDEKDKLNRIYRLIGNAADTHAFSTTTRLIGDKEAIELQDFLRSITKTETKPAEWNEEDEKMRNAILQDLANIKAAYPKINIQDEFNWLKSLRIQPKMEWSEEDEEQLKGIIELLPNLTNRHAWLCGIKQRLKSLRPQPHWKPSEEQMKCLDDCVNRAREVYNASTSGYDAYHTLRSLYHDLQKLL